jgi:hypothetical protein
MPNTPVNPDLKGYQFTDYRQEIWGDSFNWDFVRQLSQVQKLVIHHTVTDHNATPDYIALLHKNRGWAGIGYHFVVSYDGHVWYVGDIGLGRANVANNNEKVIGISLIGSFDKELPSAHQILATNRLCKYFMESYPALVNINDWDDVWGHKDCVAWAGSEATTCPSPAWRNEGDSLFNRIKDANYKGYPDWQNAKGVPAETPTPTPVPTPEPPKPPAVITDPLALVDLGSYGQLELRKVKELLDAGANNLKTANDKITVLDGQLTIKAGEVTKLTTDLKTEQDKNAPLGALKEEVRKIVFGKGWPWQKVSAVKKLYPAG